jgi:hypothetical protein
LPWQRQSTEFVARVDLACISSRLGELGAYIGLLRSPPDGSARTRDSATGDPDRKGD